MAKCKGCGEEIADDVMFCPKCGVRQNSSSDREENIDKIVANTATITDDVSSVISDAHNLVKFGKKVGKATVKEVTEKKEGASLKSRVVAALLAFFLGTIGAHGFYLGKKVTGIFHFLITVIAIILLVAENGGESIGVVLLILNWCIAVIEAVLFLFGAGKDGNGLPVKNWT